jgi:transcriptional regulator with XRE-family HTH domain
MNVAYVSITNIFHKSGIVNMKMDIITLKWRLTIARSEAKLSQKDLSGAVGVSRETIINWEKGTTQPSPINIKDIAHKCNVSEDWLLTGQDPHPKNPKSKIVQNPEGLMTESQKDQMIETQGKLIKSLEAKIEELKGNS